MWKKRRAVVLNPLSLVLIAPAIMAVGQKPSVSHDETPSPRYKSRQFHVKEQEQDQYCEY